MTSVRPADGGDLESVCALDRLVAGDARRRSLAAAISAGRCLAATAGSRLVGYAIWDCSFYDQGFIKLLVVHPQHRRRGVATALIRHIESVCPTEKLFTSTNESNVAMQRVCQGLGFMRTGYIENLDEGDPELVYFKRLRSRGR
ncbi:MAG: GNAT family N-acetyltransferase [Chloroflexi bacterium]|nr:GNAT family N-acetyltransferase [Chloroflexota bacterium]